MFNGTVHDTSILPSECLSTRMAQGETREIDRQAISNLEALMFKANALVEINICRFLLRHVAEWRGCVCMYFNQTNVSKTWNNARCTLPPADAKFWIHK